MIADEVETVIKSKARIQILSRVCSFPEIRSKDWTCDMTVNDEVRVGDLVAMSSAPASKWYLSWVLEIKPDLYGGNFLLESIDDGSLCWWTNIGLSWYDREKVRDNPHWRWTDKQFAFQARWWKVAYKWNDAYIMLPFWPVFDDNGAVTIGVRMRHSLSDFRKTITFPNWKKVLMKDMDEFYKASWNEYESVSRLAS